MEEQFTKCPFLFSEVNGVKVWAECYADCGLNVGGNGTCAFTMIANTLDHIAKRVVEKIYAE